MSLELLKENTMALEKQLFWLKRSFDKVKQIQKQDNFDFDELDAFENLSSRFARSIDFLIRKVFRSIDEAEFENQGTLIDVVNNAHKRSLFDAIEQVRALKDLRNGITHEYLDDHLPSFFRQLLTQTPILITIIENTLLYIAKVHIKK